MSSLIPLLEEVRACRLCEAHLPLGPHPVVRAGQSARLLIVGQAPGTRVHETGIPWNDPSGDRLRDWLAFVDFEVERVDYCCFRGPMSTACGERWEALGRRHNLPLGESYMIQAQRRQRHAPVQRVKFGLRAPVSPSSLGATRTGAPMRYPAGQRRLKKDSERE